MRRSLMVLLVLCLITFGGNLVQAQEINILMETVPDTDYVIACLDQFEKESGIKVNIEAITYASMHEKLLPQLLGKSTYDVIVVDKQWVGEFVSAGWLEPLDPYIEASGFDTSVYVPSLFNQVGQVNGVTYMLPFYNYSMGLVYRTDIFADEDLKAAYKAEFGTELKVPTEVDEFVQVAKFMTREYKGQQLYGLIPQLARGVGIHAEWANLMYALGGDYFDENWNATVNSGGALAAAELLLELYKTCAPVAATSYDFDEVFTAMSQGQGAMMVTYGWMLASLNNPANSRVAGNVDMTIMPGGHGVGGGWGWAIPANSSNKDAAWAFLNWVESFDVAKQRALLGGSPTRTDIFEDADVRAKYPATVTMQQIVENGRPMPVMTYANAVVEVLARELSQIIVENKTVKAGMDTAAAEMNELVKNDPLVK